MSANDKSTEMCTRVIKKYLDERAKVDALFAVSYAKPVSYTHLTLPTIA